MYQLWELDSRNCVAEFPTHEDAIAAIDEMVAAIGPRYADSLVVVFEDEEDDTKGRVISGHDYATT